MLHLDYFRMSVEEKRRIAVEKHWSARTTWRHQTRATDYIIKGADKLCNSAFKRKEKKNLFIRNIGIRAQVYK